MLLTTKRNDAHSMQLVLRSDVWPCTDDKDVSKAGSCRNNPNKHLLYYTGKQVLQRRNAICVWLAVPHMRGKATILELLKISVDSKKSYECNK